MELAPFDLTSKAPTLVSAGPYTNRSVGHARADTCWRVKAASADTMQSCESDRTRLLTVKSKANRGKRSQPGIDFY